jgi:hypothetical protein
MARIKIGNVRTPIEYLQQFFAPAGYGLGENTAKLYNANEITKTGFYLCDTNTPDNPTDDPNNAKSWWYGVHVQYYSDYAFQEMHKFDSPNHHIFRQKIKGEWQPWDYIDPPLPDHTEYRTRERYMLKPVYTKLIICGNMPNATTKSYAHNIEGIVTPLRCCGRYGNIQVIPGITSEGETKVSFDATNIYIHSSSDLSQHTAYVQLWYTKD